MKTKLDLQTFTILAPPSELARRTLLRGLGSALVAAPLWWPLLACDDGTAANDNGGADAGAAGTNGAGGVAGAGGAGGSGATAVVDWARG